MNTLVMYPKHFEINSMSLHILDFTLYKLQCIIDSVEDIQFREMFVFKLIGYYGRIAKEKASKQHKGCRGTTRHRDDKGVTYGKYKSLVIQLKNLQDEVKYEIFSEGVEYNKTKQEN